MEHYTSQRNVPPSSTTNPMALILGTSSEPTKKTNYTKYLSLTLISCLLLGLLGLGINTISVNKPKSSQVVNPRTTFVHLFEWRWDDIADECVNYLGPNGFSAVQVSPPNEHIDHRLVKTVNPEVGDDFPWWARYQPVSYKLISRSGTREEFKKMIDICQNVGVDIYVDVLLNHMARDNVGVGIAGTQFNSQSLSYADYSSIDFNECTPSGIQGEDYSNNADRVRRCRLADLPDLNHDLFNVRKKLTDFVQDMVSLGVKGFRLDAGKHMYPHDVNAILDPVVGDFYVFSEVYDFGFEAVSGSEYTPFYDITEFRYELTLGNIFTNGRLADLYGIGESFGYVSSLDAVVFVDNHDSQRHTNAKMVYRKGRLYDLANVFLLAWPYGYPKIMSSYAFEDGEFNKGPPSDSQGNTRRVYNEDGSMNCYGTDWVCEHRRKPMSNMVKFKNFVSGQNAYGVAHWWTNNFQAIGFARVNEETSIGYVFINRENFLIEQTVLTGLADGEYCNLLGGLWDGCGNECGICDEKVQVRNGGYLELKIEPMSALAIHI